MDRCTIQKTRFLAVYDYGTGGVWAFVLARTSLEIEKRFTNLRVVDHAPSWMTHEKRVDLEERMTFDIDDINPNDWIAQLLK